MSPLDSWRLRDAESISTPDPNPTKGVCCRRATGFGLSRSGGWGTLLEVGSVVIEGKLDIAFRSVDFAAQLSVEFVNRLIVLVGGGSLGSVLWMSTVSIQWIRSAAVGTAIFRWREVGNIIYLRTIGPSGTI